MGLNIGYLTSDKSSTADESYTPYYAVDPILKYIPKDKTIWCPCDAIWSAFYQSFIRGGYQVIRSCIEEGQDFFTYQPSHWDLIVTNPLFSIKDKIISRLYELNKPFAVLLPLNSLQGKSRYKFFKNGIQLLSFDSRIAFHNSQNMQTPIKGTPFASAYFCRNILPKDLIVEKLQIYNKPLI